MRPSHFPSTNYFSPSAIESLALSFTETLLLAGAVTVSQVERLKRKDTLKKLEEMQKRNAAAITIQSAVRGHILRQSFFRILRDVRERPPA